MQADLFDVAEGERRKANGIAAASIPRQELLRLARECAIHYADRNGLICTIDDVQRELLRRGYEPYQLGNAAGGVFRGKCWREVGWKKSERTSNNRRRVMIWKYDPRESDE